MGLLVAILIVVICYYYFLFKPKKLAEQEKREAAEYEHAKESSFTQGTLKAAMSLANAVRKIKEAGQCSISPLTIAQADTDSGIGIVRIKMSFTIYGIRTGPFYDLEMAWFIAKGEKQPKCIIYPNEEIKKLEEAHPQGFISDVDEYYQKSKVIEKQSYEAIYRQLFGINKNFFDRPIDGFELETTQYPVGDVTVMSDSNSLLLNQYRKCFAYIFSELESAYADAEVTKSEHEIKISF